MSCIKPNVSNIVVDENGNRFNSIRSLAKFLNVDKDTISRKFKKGYPYQRNGHTYTLENLGFVNIDGDANTITNTQANTIPTEYAKEYTEFLESKKVSELPFERYEFKFNKRSSGTRYAVALFSDAHIEETVKAASVMGLNEYNVEIAKQRIEKYFANLVNCLNTDRVEYLLFASLGDTISGFIHEELSQSNELTPLEATFEAQNLIYNGLKFICENTKLKRIKFVGIVGNHSRVTKKIQHSNGYKMSYEWLMYKNIEKQAEIEGLPIEFDIPESEMAIEDTSDGKRFLFIHGFQIKGSGNGTVCGIYPALGRLSLKYGKVYKQDKIYLGHFHSCISIPNAVVNGSIIGYNGFALTNGFAYEEPAQMYELYDTNIGQLLTRQIYCK